jgi:hypothetical protein
VPVLLVAVIATDGFARTNRADVRGVCSTTGVDVFFWPQGHPAVPAIGFPAFAPAHVEFYRARDIRGAAQFGYMDLTQGALSPSQCTSSAEGKVAFVTGAAIQTSTETGKLRCTLVGNVDLQVAAAMKTTRRVVTRLVEVKGSKKKRKVRKTITSTTRIGNRGSISAAGGAGAVAEVLLSTDAATPSSLKFDSRACALVDLTG